MLLGKNIQRLNYLKIINNTRDYLQQIGVVSRIIHDIFSYFVKTYEGNKNSVGLSKKICLGKLLYVCI